MRLRVADIKIPERFRQDVGDISDLAESIKKSNGQFVCVWVKPLENGQYELIAGRRRLLACEVAGVVEVEALVGTDLSEPQRRELELEENLCRKDMTDEEKVDAMAEIHRLYSELYKDTSHKPTDEGRGGQSKYGPATLSDTALRLGVSEAKMSIYLQLAKEKETSPTVRAALRKDGIKAGYKQLLHEKEQATIAELANANAMLAAMPKQDTDTPEEDIHNMAYDQAKKMLLHGDCLDLIQAIPTGSVDLLYTDPEYGVYLDKLFAKEGAFAGNVYKNDTPEKYQNLIEVLAVEWFRVLKADSFAFIWLGFEQQEFTKRVMEKAGFTYRNPPFFWLKVGGSHACYSPRTNFASGVDIAMLFSKGQPVMLKQGQPNYSIAEQVPSQFKVHPAERPLALGCQVLPIFVHAGCTVLDTFGGSCSTAKSCIELGLNCIVMEKEDAYYNRAVLDVTEFIKSKIAPKQPELELGVPKEVLAALSSVGWSSVQLARMTLATAERILTEKLAPEKCSILPDGSLIVIEEEAEPESANQ